MPRHRTGAGTPAGWLERAKSNLALAKNKTDKEVYLEDLCFNAQQAAEKALKAVLQHKAIVFRFIHDLEELLTTLEKNNVELPKNVKAAAALTEYAVEIRYPGAYEAVTDEEYHQAVAFAEHVVQWAQEIVTNKK